MVWSLDIAIRDGKGKIGHVGVYLPDATTVLGVSDFLEAFVIPLDALIDGVITGVSASLGLPLPPGIKTVSEADSDREEGALFIYDTVGGFSTKQRIPTFKEALLVSGTTQVNQADLDVSSFVSFMVDGVPSVADPCDYRGADIQALASALEDFKRY